MWSKSYSVKVKNINPEKIWNVWIDVNNWYTWQDDIDLARLDGKMEIGKEIKFKPKGGPHFNLKITDFIPQKKFTDLTTFPLAKMIDDHEVIQHENGEVELKTTISITGPLSFIWRKIVAEDIVASLPKQTAALLERVNNV